LFEQELTEGSVGCPDVHGLNQLFAVEKHEIFKSWLALVDPDYRRHPVTPRSVTDSIVSDGSSKTQNGYSVGV
jgi:hypothetical protein